MAAPLSGSPQPAASSHGRWRRRLHTKQRLLACIGLGILAYGLLPDRFTGATRLLIGWDVGAGSYLILSWWMMLASNVHQMRRRAALQDEADWVILLLAVAAALASLGAIGAELHGIRATAGAAQFGPVLLVGGTILVSWFFVHTLLAVHYAHDYYARPDAEPELVFPERIREPGYDDFLYVAFTIGAACQTSDVTIASPRLRRLVLAHTILSFLFNTTILALAINVGASLL